MGNEEKERSKQNNIKTKAINSFRFRSEPVRVDSLLSWEWAAAAFGLRPDPSNTGTVSLTENCQRQAGVILNDTVSHPKRQG